jgi:hypothetical protein
MGPDFDVFLVDPKPIPSAVPGFDAAVGPATWPPTTSTLISDDGRALLVDCLITALRSYRGSTWRVAVLFGPGSEDARGSG